MTEYESYPEYKESGIEWLGEIPTEWKVTRIGSAFTQRKEKVSDKDFPPLSVTKNGIVPQLETAVKTDDGDNRKLVRKNDFVINSRSDRKGSSGISEYDGSVSLISTILKAKVDLEYKFIHHLLRSVDFQEEYYRNGRGIVADLWTTRYSDMKGIAIPLPPLKTQQAIVEFLERETIHIDAGIANMEALIVLLAEKRSALISETVTRGIPGEHTEFKDSGVAWLGEIPADRTKISFGQLFKRIKNMGTGDEELLSVYREYGVIPKSSRTDNHNVASEDLSKYQIVSKNNLVINKMKAWQGSLAISDYDGIVSPAYFVFEERGKYKNNLKFLHYLMRSNSYKGFYVSISKGIRLGQWDLDQKSHKSMPIFLPPADEQDRIVAFIDSELPKIDALVNEAKFAIALLKEQRQTLISDVVTGKIDVTNNTN